MSKNPHIKTALESLARANVAGYFTHMDKAAQEVGADLEQKAKLKGLQNEFISGRYGADFYQRLSALAEEFDNVKVSPSIVMPAKKENIGKREIQFLSANPERKEGKLAVDVEYREIRNRLSSSTKRDGFDLKTPLLAVTINDLLKEFETIKPQVLHFAGHGAQTHILIANDSNEPTELSTKNLLRFLKKQPNLELLVLNCCFSEDVAIDISKELPNLYITGMNNQIDDKASIAFATGLYIRLGEGASIESAFEGGLIKVETEHPKEKHTPTLWKAGAKIDM